MSTDEASELDLRRQDQIANQVKVINRLLHDGKYDKMVKDLCTDLVDEQAKNRRLREAGSEALRLYNVGEADLPQNFILNLQELLDG